MLFDFLFNLRFLVSLTVVGGAVLAAMPGLDGSGILGFAASVIASPLDLMFMTALVMTTALPGAVDRGSSLWLLVSESEQKEPVLQKIVPQALTAFPIQS